MSLNKFHARKQNANDDDDDDDDVCRFTEKVSSWSF